MQKVMEGGPRPTIEILQSDWSCRFSGGRANPGIGLTPNFLFLVEGRPRLTNAVYCTPKTVGSCYV